MESFNLCIIKPNKDAFSETFVQEHINRLPGNKKVLYGGAFPVYDHEGNFLIRSKLGLISYLIQKKIFKKKDIKVRTKALVNYLKREKTDVVFAEYGMVGAMVTSACKIAGVPLVIHFHGADVYHKKTVEAYHDLYQRAFNYASAFISVSADMVTDLQVLGAPANKIHLASCGVDTNLFPQLDISNTGQNFLSIGRFVEKKSPASVVKAFKLVREKVPGAKLWMVGQGPLFDETKALVTELMLDENITLTGVLKTDEIKKLMRQSRCFVQHSVTAASGDKEGTPVTILEAGSSGLAIVSTQHSGIKEAVINGQTGYLVPEHDIQGMADYMIKIANDVQLASELGIREAAHIRENYDIRHRINTLTTILQQAIKQN
ncbi:glycosyltransferase [Mucilaginibacter sabulilitoris]|uniref:Glycosyltransferase n=1 Tax=Mucilaginibacter sabulilitoris TaxID=1173583 RepID=A0ABZ0TK60_9SPHI|nr:glycosyltransferase [Mucilaginibacter sabulilitoris]WPU93554.1 glycosyltransferase [Mucilaginibacter sabulilitoris]